MKKNILFLFALFALIISCDDIETNDPAFQALIENYLYRSNDARAEIKADGSLVIQGLTEFEQLSITLNNSEAGTYILSGNGINRAAYQDQIGSIYTTRPFGHGEVIISSSGSSVTGTFNFTAYRFGLDTIVANQGHFYNVPIVSGSTEEEPDPETFHFFAKVNGSNFNPTTITAVDNGNNIIITGEVDGNSIALRLPNLISVGSYDVDNETYLAAYAEGTNIYPTESGSITVTSHNLDLDLITGTFAFSVGEPDNITITQGEFGVYY